MPAISSSASGKTILFGEHAVVYGYPAIAVPIKAIKVNTIFQPQIGSKSSVICLKNKNESNEFILEQLNDSDLFRGIITRFQDYLQFPIPPFYLTLTSNIPIAAGLGSSAAVAISIIRGLSQFVGKKLSVKEVNEIAYQSEIIQHGKPSGIDNTVISYEKPVFFQKGKQIQTIDLHKELYLVLADSGERTLTKEVVNFVGKSRETSPDKYHQIFTAIGDISDQAKVEIINGNQIRIGSLMTKNHFLLQKMSVSTSTLDRMVEKAVLAGAFGAKLCGGGRGGFMVAICDKDNQNEIAQHLRTISQNVIETKV